MTLPSRTLEDIQVFTAFCKNDPSVSFVVHAMSELSAKVQALDKIGYAVFETPDGQFYVVDADDQELIVSKLEAEDLAEAVTEAFFEIQWALTEPQQLIGGTMGSGFGFEEQ